MKSLFTLLLICIAGIAQAQNVGIGTTEPKARLHVADSNVLFTGGELIGTLTSLPVSGRGARMMWIPTNASFRAGFVNGNFWDHDKIGVASFAAGRNTRASGSFATALGDGTIASGIKLFPVPAGTTVQLSFTSGSNQKGSIRIFNAQGQQVKIQPASIQQGNNVFTIDVRSLPAGAYYLQLVLTRQQSLTERFIKQ